METKIMHPFVKYPGGKTKEIPLVQKYMPENPKRYIEPFVGGGSIYYALNIHPSFINDKSQDLFNIYDLIKNQNEDFHKLLLQMSEDWDFLENDGFVDHFKQHSFVDYDKFVKFYQSSLNRKAKTINKFISDGVLISEENKRDIEITARKTAYYMVIRDLYNSKDLNWKLRTSCFYFLREYCYSSMFRFSSKGDFNVPYGGMSYNSKRFITKIDYIFSNEMKEYMKDTAIYNDDFADFLDKLNLTENDFMFLDPPYDSDFSTYDNNPFDKNEQIRLRDYLKNTKAKWMLIIKKTDFIYNLYKDFNIFEYDMNYMVSFKNRNDKDVQHLLITNYEIKGDE